MVVGAPRSNIQSDRWGSVYVFERIGAAWEQVQKINAPAGAKMFGSSVALDGDVFVVGAPYSEAYGDDGAGIAFAYEYDALQGKFVKKQRFDSPLTLFDARMGSDVDVSGDAIVIAAPGDYDIINGQVFAYRRTGAGSTWTYEGRIEPTSAPSFTSYGASVSMDGDRVVVANKHPFLSWGGLAVVFSYDSGASTWIEEDVVLPTAPSPNDNSATNVDIEGDLMLVDARGSSAGVGGGTVSVFEWNGTTSSWDEAQVLVASDAQESDSFGSNVKLSNGKVLIQASGVDEAGVALGAVYVFERAAPGGPFEESYRLLPDQEFTGFGWRGLDLAGDEILIGAGFYNGAHEHQGAVYQFSIAPCGPVGFDYCFGSACPCRNDDAGAGCQNSTGVGASLVAMGSTSVVIDNLSFTASNLKANGPALLFSGNSQVSGGQGAAFGDGLLCTGGAIRRLGAQLADGNGEATWGADLFETFGWASPGETRQAQVWYRDPTGSPCGGSFNTTQGIELVLAP